TVGVAIRRQSHLPPAGAHFVAHFFEIFFDGLGIDASKRCVSLGMNLIDRQTKNRGEESTASPVERIDQNLEFRFFNRIDIKQASKMIHVFDMRIEIYDQST